MELGLGYLEDTPDERDILLSSVLSLPKPPASDDHLEPHVKSILQQGSLEACVGYAAAQAFRTLLSLHGHEPILPSPGFIWWNSRKQHNDESINSGTYMRVALKTTNTLGICSDRYWPSNQLVQRFDLKPSRLAYRAAYDARFDIKFYRISGYGEQRVEQIQTAISKGFPVLVGAKVTKAFTQLGDHSAVPVPKADDKIAGGHAVCAATYDGNGLKGPNSWGMWGNHGWFHLSWDYIMSPFTHDLWALTLVPKLKG